MSKVQLKVVLFQPEIPHNAGAAIRLCAGMNAELHLIRPLGFSVSDKHLRRVALGYHEVLNPTLHSDMSQFLDSVTQDEELYLFSSKARRQLDQIKIGRRSALLFGSESQGFKAVPAATQLRLAQRARSVKILQAPGFRCHNLSNSIAMGAYEVMRQWNFPGLC